MWFAKLVLHGFLTFSAICIVQRLIYCNSVSRCIGINLQCLWCFMLLWFYLPHTNQLKIWQLYCQDHLGEETGYREEHLSEGGWEVIRHQGLPWGAVAVAILQAPPSVFTPNDVPPCCCHQEACYTLGQAETLNRTRYGGGINCNGAHPTWFFLQWYCRPLLQCVSAMEVTREGALQ